MSFTIINVPVIIHPIDMKRYVDEELKSEFEERDVLADWRGLFAFGVRHRLLTVMPEVITLPKKLKTF